MGLVECQLNSMANQTVGVERCRLQSFQITIKQLSTRMQEETEAIIVQVTYLQMCTSKKLLSYSWLLSCHSASHFYSLAAAEQHSKLQFNLIQNTHVIQCLIENARWLFNVEEKTVEMNGFPSLVMPPFPSTASNSNVAKKSFSGSNGQILQMQPKYEEREIKFKTAAIPSSVSTSQINKQLQPTFLERVRYIQPAAKQIPLSKR